MYIQFPYFYSCTSIPSNSLCTDYEIYFDYTEDVDLLNLEFTALNYIENNVTNQYCRNYLKAAICATIYPPCNVSNNGSVQRLCPEVCDNLLNSSTCSSDTTSMVAFVSSHVTDHFTVTCSNSLSFASMFMNTSIHSNGNCISILENTEVPPT